MHHTSRPRPAARLDTNRRPRNYPHAAPQTARHRSTQAAGARRARVDLPAAARHRHAADPAGRPCAFDRRDRGSLERLAGDRVPLLPEPQRADHRGDRPIAEAGAQLHLRLAGRPRAGPRAVRRDLSALQGIRAADARGDPADARAVGPEARRPARGRDVPARPPGAHPRACARTARAGPAASPACAPAPGAVDHLRHRAVRDPEGHLGPVGSGDRAHRAVDGRRDGRGDLARRRAAAAGAPRGGAREGRAPEGDGGSDAPTLRRRSARPPPRPIRCPAPDGPGSADGRPSARTARAGSDRPSPAIRASAPFR